MLSELLVPVDCMDLEGDEALCRSLVNEVGARNTVEPCADAVADSLYTCMVPLSVSECSL